MSNNSENTKRIAKNTVMLYIRMLLGMLVSLYTSRVVLQALGVEDYGIYNVVGGIVIMFSALNSSMSGATSRFLAYELGKKDKVKLNETFSTALLIHIIIAFIVIILSETIGLWLLNTKLIIPKERMFAVHILYQLSIFSTAISITQVPYNACIIAHEKMKVYAYVEILNVLLRLLIVYLLLLCDVDKLIFYAILQFIVSFIIMMIYRLYSLYKYSESKFCFVINRNILNPMLNFSGWDFLGNMSMMIRGQGVNMLLNMFFGPTVNAASGIATSVVTATTSLSNNFLMAVKPYITKQYAKGNIIDFSSSVYFSSKMSYLLTSLFAIPIIIRCEQILKVWLMVVPNYAVTFCQLVLIQQLIASTSQPIIQAIHATGKIKFLSLFNGTLNILIIPFSFVILKYSILDPNVCYILNVLLTISAVTSNMWNLSTKINFSLCKYIKEVILPCYGSGIFLLIILWIISGFLNNGIMDFTIILLVHVFFYSFISYMFVLNKNERLSVKSIILKIKCLQK